VNLPPTLHSCIVIIPAYNEAHDIAAVIADVRRACDFPIVLVDDCSDDDTIAQARQAGATVLPLCIRMGAWGAIQTGLRFAKTSGFRCAITVDADGQHPAAAIPALLAPITAGTADVVIGNCTQRGSRPRLLAWRLLRSVSQLAVDDLTSGLRAYNPAAIDLLVEDSATLLEYQDLGVLMLAKANGLRIMEVPVAMRPRLSGLSRVFASWTLVAYYMACTVILGFSKRSLKRAESRD
jgi:glycosyltransferase involved in cell wall biosynthesis